MSFRLSVSIGGSNFGFIRRVNNWLMRRTLENLFESVCARLEAKRSKLVEAWRKFGRRAAVGSSARMSAAEEGGDSEVLLGSDLFVLEDGEEGRVGQRVSKALGGLREMMSGLRVRVRGARGAGCGD